jgi:predicted protein tyrosine phosphatase
MKILFICSRNKWRSRTAETIFKDHPLHQVRSAGTARNAVVKVTEKLINWSELIFVMEKKHKQILQEKFGLALNAKKIVILEITDDYLYMDVDLIENLKTSLDNYFTDK